jgi:hypothetical protein
MSKRKKNKKTNKQNKIRRNERCTDPHCACSGYSMDEHHRCAEQMLSTYGFYSHYVREENGYINAHTHGVQETFGTLDFQIVLPLPVEEIINWFHSIVRSVRDGDVFYDGLEVAGLRFVERIESGRRVFRVIFPNACACGRPECQQMVDGQEAVTFTGYTGEVDAA